MDRAYFNKFLVAYTWSKSIDLAASGDFGAEGTSLQNPYNPRADRSVSGFDLTHIFSGSLVYELPFGRGRTFDLGNRIASYLAGGWQINSIVNLSSGAPYQVNYSGDLANTGNTFVRANQIGPASPANRTPRQWLNPASFVAPPAYTFGTMGRNSLRNDPTRNLDLSVFRAFPIHEALVLNLRAETFNLTNTAVFSTPNATLNNTNFGVVTSTRNNPRQIQVAVKLTF